MQRKNREKMYLRERVRQRRILKSSKETVRRADELLNEGSKLLESHGNIWKGKLMQARYTGINIAAFFFLFFSKLNLAQRQVCIREIINRSRYTFRTQVIYFYNSS